MPEVNAEKPITTLVRRRLKPGASAEFSAVMRELMEVLLQQPGHLGINVIRHTPESDEYLILDRFCTAEARRQFTASAAYAEFMERLGKLSEVPPVIEENEGLSFWFEIPSGEGPRAAAPPRWKMALVTLLGVYPLSMLFPALVVPATPGWPGALRGLLIAALIVVSLTWVVMPVLTRVLRPLIHPQSQ